ncbi:MAG: Tetracycline resistance protein, class C [Candidatus Anoxychlamydiales bacterium]|nr:Tetracycline resistance protein, class C [Candidatus Anoxychlamydiales bacterium]
MIKLREKTSLYLILFIVFFNYVGIGLVYPVFSSMLFLPESSFINPETSFSMKGVYLGILLCCTPIASFFSGPFLGTLSDQKGRKPLFIISLSVGVLGYVFCVFGVLLKSVFILMFARVIIGIANGNIGVVNAAIVDLSDAKTKTKFFGFYSMALGVGFTIGPFLGGMFSKSGFVIPFLVAGIAILINLFLILFFFYETHDCSYQKKDVKFLQNIFNLKKVFYIPNIRDFFIIIVIYCFGWSIFYEFLPVIWIEYYGFDVAKIGFFFAYGAGFYALSSGLLIKPVINRYAPQKILFYTLCGMGCLILLVFLPLNSFFVWIYLPIFELLGALIYPSYNTIISNAVDKDSQGEILGISGSIQSLAYGISPLLGGVFLGLNIHMPIFLGGISMLIAAIIVRKIALRKKFIQNF